MRLLRLLVVLPVLALLGGCGTVVMHPSGDIAVQQRNLILASTGLMLLIIVPVILATILFAWRYRASNTSAAYAPDWHHSTQLEVLIWTAPLLIVIALGALTWISTHVLDPFRVDRPHRCVPAPGSSSGWQTFELSKLFLSTGNGCSFIPDLGIADRQRACCAGRCSSRSRSSMTSGDRDEHALHPDFAQARSMPWLVWKPNSAP